MSFNFIGNVTRVATSGSLPLTTIAGEELFIKGSGLSSWSADNFVPAWMVQEAGDNEIQKAKDGKVALLSVTQRQVPFRFQYLDVVTPKSLQRSLTIYTLTPTPSSIGLTNIPLYRTAIPDMVTSAKAPTKGPAAMQPKGKSKGKAQAKSRSDDTWLRGVSTPTVLLVLFEH